MNGMWGRVCAQSMKGTSGVAEQGRNSKWNHIGKIPRPTQFEEKDEYEVYGEVKPNSV